MDGELPEAHPCRLVCVCVLVRGDRGTNAGGLINRLNLKSYEYIRVRTVTKEGLRRMIIMVDDHGVRVIVVRPVPAVQLHRAPQPRGPGC